MRVTPRYFFTIIVRASRINAMKKLALSFALSGLIFGVIAAQTPSARPTITQDEINKLNAEVIKLYGANKFDEALPLAEKTVRYAETLWGADNAQTGVFWKNLAEIQFALKKYSDAVTSFEKAVKLHIANSSASTLPLANMLIHAGIACFEAGQLDKAIKNFAQSLAIRESQLPKNDLLIAEAAELLGQIYGLKSDWNKAAAYYQQSLTIAKPVNI